MNSLAIYAISAFVGSLIFALFTSVYYQIKFKDWNFTIVNGICYLLGMFAFLIAVALINYSL